MPLNDRFGIVPGDSDGRTRLQATLWKKDVLQSAFGQVNRLGIWKRAPANEHVDLLTLSYMGRDNIPIPVPDVSDLPPPLDTRGNFALPERAIVYSVLAFDSSTVMSPGAGACGAVSVACASLSRWRGKATTRSISTALHDKPNVASEF